MMSVTLSDTCNFACEKYTTSFQNELVYQHIVGEIV